MNRAAAAGIPPSFVFGARRTVYRLERELGPRGCVAVSEDVLQHGDDLEILDLAQRAKKADLRTYGSIGEGDQWTGSIPGISGASAPIGRPRV